MENHLRKVLVENYTLLRTKNPAYSVRSFARKLGISPASLSQMMAGKRPISKKTAEKVFASLNFSPEEREKFVKIERRKKALTAENNKYLQIEMDQYHIISDWHYFAVLSLAETESFQSDPEWISERLGIKIIEAKQALERLERLKLLEKKSGKLIPTGSSFKTSSDISSAALRKSHSDNLDLARKSLESDPVDVRDISSMTMAIDPELLPEAKKLIAEFRRKLTQFLESEKKIEVYKLNIQLFPLTTKEDAK